eukprot:3598389-Alexandrium_andersonii.AAC.1
MGGLREAHESGGCARFPGAAPRFCWARSRSERTEETAMRELCELRQRAPVGGVCVMSSCAEPVGTGGAQPPQAPKNAAPSSRSGERARDDLHE